MDPSPENDRIYMLKKTIPQHVETVKFNWVKTDWMPMSQNYRDIRNKWNKGTMCHCKWCGHDFDDGEMMALASPQGSCNWVICQKCVSRLEVA